MTCYVENSRQIGLIPINYLNDLQLHPLISLYSNKAGTDCVDDSIDELLVHVLRIRALASQLTICYQLLLVQKRREIVIYFV